MELFISWNAKKILSRMFMLPFSMYMWTETNINDLMMHYARFDWHQWEFSVNFVWYNVEYNVQYVLLQKRPWRLHKSSAKTLASRQSLGTDPYGQLWTCWTRTSWDQNAVLSRRTFIVLKASNKPVIYYWLKSSSSFMFFDLLDTIQLFLPT